MLGQVITNNKPQQDQMLFNKLLITI